MNRKTNPVIILANVMIMTNGSKKEELKRCPFTLKQKWRREAGWSGSAENRPETYYIV